MKKLTFPLVVILTLNLILGITGCGKRPSTVIPPSIVESISPSSGASGVSADAAVTIQFKSPVWASQTVVPHGGEPLQLDSSKVADRFRVIDAATGEIVPGTVTIENSKKVTFKLAAGESWKPNNTYWIEGTADTSLEETIEKETWQNLFLSAFTTQDLDADQFLVHHPIGGSWTTLLNDIAYDVDTSRSLSFDELKNWIETAPSEAGRTSLTKFHFWPNIINLTEVYYWEENHRLFNDILDQLLEREPNNTQLKSQLTAQVARGDRAFCARDFISSLVFGFKTYWEVHYGLLINLDNADQTGVRRPYVQEILVHEYGAEGLPLLRDLHTEKLATCFAASATIPLGKAWDLCLRGNLKKTKYNAMVVDKLDEAPDAEFYVERIELTCGCDFFSDLDTSIPVVPGKPKPPPHPEPVPLFERQPLPKKPSTGPHEPPKPKLGPGVPPIHPWPFPVDPFPPEDTIGIPAEDAQPRPTGIPSKNCELPVPRCQDKSSVESKWKDVKSKHDAEKKNRASDNQTFENFVYYGWWPEYNEYKFKYPCLQKFLEEYQEKAKPLMKKRDDNIKKIRELSEELREKRDSMDAVLQVVADRKHLWSTLFEWRGAGTKKWRELSVPCQVLVPSIAFDVRIIGVEPQHVFQDKVATGLMNGQTWETAVKSALTAMEAEAKKSISAKEWAKAYAEGQWATIWQGYAKCLKNLYDKQLDNFLESRFGRLSPDQLKQMRNIMFNGASKQQQNEYDRIRGEIERPLNSQLNNLCSQNNRLMDELEKIRQEFRAKALECCFDKWTKNIRGIWQLQEILEAYIEWCQSSNNDKKIVFPISAGDLPRLCSVLCQLQQDKECAGFKFNDCEGLASYVEWLIRCMYACKCADIVEPCNPKCEVCLEKTPPPAVTPGITPPPTFTPTLPPLVLPPTTVTPPKDVLPPTTQVLRAEASANVKSLRDERGCSSTLIITYSVQDLTGGSYPVIKVLLTVNGQSWHDSGIISTVNYQNSVSKQVWCGQTFNIQVTATNKSGQMVTVPGSITTPIP